MRQTLQEQGRVKILGCIRATPPCPLHGRDGDIGIEEAGIVYRELQRLKNPDKYPQPVVAADLSTTGLDPDGSGQEVVAMDTEPNNAEVHPVLAKARALAMEDLSAVFQHDQLDALGSDLRLRVASGWARGTN